MPTTAHVSRQLLCKGIAVCCPYRHRSSKTSSIIFDHLPLEHHPRRRREIALCLRNRRWNRNSALGIRAGSLLSPSHWPSAVAFTAPFWSVPRKAHLNVQPFYLSKQTQQTICNYPFVTNTWQGHLNPPFFCLVLFSSQNEKRALLPLRFYVPLFHWHCSLPQSPAYFRRMKSVLTAHCHWSLFPILIPRHSFSF